MTEQTEQTTEAEEVSDSGDLAPVSDDTAVTEVTPDDDPETFPRAYVEKLRDESAKHRQRAADRDDLAARLHAALVTATGRLADPSDLAFDDAHLADAGALTAAIDDLLARKPHLASRKPAGDVGQGASVSADSVNLAGLLRARA